MYFVTSQYNRCYSLCTLYVVTIFSTSNVMSVTSVDFFLFYFYGITKISDKIVWYIFFLLKFHKLFLLILLDGFDCDTTFMLKSSRLMISNKTYKITEIYFAIRCKTFDITVRIFCFLLFLILIWSFKTIINIYLTRDALNHINIVQKYSPFHIIATHSYC